MPSGSLPCGSLRFRRRRRVHAARGAALASAFPSEVRCQQRLVRPVREEACARCMLLVTRVRACRCSARQRMNGKAAAGAAEALLSAHVYSSHLRLRSTPPSCPALPTCSAVSATTEGTSAPSMRSRSMVRRVSASRVGTGPAPCKPRLTRLGGRATPARELSDLVISKPVSPVSAARLAPARKTEHLACGQGEHRSWGMRQPGS